MTLKEFLEYREHRFDDELVYNLKCPEEHIAYANGWSDAVKDIRTVLERHGVNLEIPLE